MVQLSNPRKLTQQASANHTKRRPSPRLAEVLAKLSIAEKFSEGMIRHAERLSEVADDSNLPLNDASLAAIATEFLEGDVASVRSSIQAITMHKEASVFPFAAVAHDQWHKKNLGAARLFALAGCRHPHERGESLFQLSVLSQYGGRWNETHEFCRVAMDAGKIDIYTACQLAISHVLGGDGGQIEETIRKLDRYVHHPRGRASSLVLGSHPTMLPNTMPVTQDVVSSLVAELPLFFVELLSSCMKRILVDALKEDHGPTIVRTADLIDNGWPLDLDASLWLRAAKICPSSTVVVRQLSNCYRSDSSEETDFSDALSRLSKTDSLDAQDFGILLDGYLSLNRESDAIRTIRDLSPTGPSRAEVGTVVANIVGNGSRRVPTELLEACLARFPDTPKLRLMLARAHSSAGRLEFARQQLGRLKDGIEANTEAQILLACLDIVAGDITSARKTLRTFLEIEPKRDDARLHLAEIEFDGGNFKAALTHWGQCSQRSYCVEFYKSVAQRSLGHHSESTKSALRAMTLASGNADKLERARFIAMSESLLSGNQDVSARVARTLETSIQAGLSWNSRLTIAIWYTLKGGYRDAQRVLSGLNNSAKPSALACLWSTYVASLDGDADEANRTAGLCVECGPQFKNDINHLLKASLGPMELSPVVTIVVPALNEARFLSDCLNSIRFQSYPFWECIIVNDGSTDETLSIAEAFAQSDSRFRIISHHTPRGLAAGRNTGLTNARGAFVTFVDGDDYLTLNSILQRVTQLRREDGDYIAGTYCGIQHAPERTFGQLVLENRKFNGRRIDLPSLGFEAPFNAHAPLLKRDVLVSVGGFDESLRHGAEDWDCWLKILRAGYFFNATPFQGGIYRQKRGSMVRSLSTKHVATALSLYRQQIDLSHLDVENEATRLPPTAYTAAVKFSKRAIGFGAMAYLDGDRSGFRSIVKSIPLTEHELESYGVVILSDIVGGVRRFYAGESFERFGINSKQMCDVYASEIQEAMRDELREEPSSKAITLLFSSSPQELTERKVVRAAASKVDVRCRKEATYHSIEEPAARLADCQRIKSLQNTHVGERCFIVGNGPSLNKIDLGKLANEISIGVNGIFYKTKETGYSPTYYVVEDTSVMRENIESIKNVEARAKIFPSIYKDIHPEADNVYFFAMNRGFYEPRSPNYCLPRFSADFSERAYCGQSVTFINLQLAHYMGFSEVYLLGMDFSYEIPDSFTRNGDVITSTGDDPNHFHPDYFGKGKTWKDPKLDRVLANYQMAKLAYETTGRKIYNATYGGALELFERVDFEDLF